MNANTKILALMTALSAGVAGAAGTPAGTVINNTASVTFTDPGTNAAATPVYSNQVSTTVLPKPDFDVIYINAADGTTATGTLPSGYEGQVLPGRTLATAYSVQNSGNVNNQVITLAAETTGSPTAVPAGNVNYYLDTNGDGILNATELSAGAITSVTVPVDDPATTADEGQVRIIQVITVPTGAAPGAQYAASPRGTGDKFVNGAVATNQQEASTDLQFSRAVVYTPSVTNGPVDSDPATNGQQDPTTSVTPPGQNTAVPGYNDPSRPTTNIVVISSGNQGAYPKADADTNADKVTFVNSVFNGGTQSDTVNLFPTDKTGPGGLPVGTKNADGSFTVQVSDGKGGTTTAIVRFLDTNGQPLPLSADGYPSLTVPAGATANYRTEVTYPDYDSDSATTIDPIRLIIGVDSGNDAGIGADSTTRDTIFPGQVQFGDATTPVGTAPTPTPNQQVVVSTVGTDGTPAATGTSLDPSATNDRTAIFPMDVANTGAYADTFVLKGTVSFDVVGGGTAATPEVRYYTDTNGDNTPDNLLSRNSDGSYTTAAVQPGTEIKVWAVVDVPANAARTTTPVAVTQTLTGVYSTIVRTDNNDTVSVGATGGVQLSKAFTSGTPNQGRPGDTLSYTIVAKNNYNTSVANLIVTEANTSAPDTRSNIFSFTTFKALTVSKTFTSGTVLYRFSTAAATGGWQASATPTVPLKDIIRVDVGVDNSVNGSGNGLIGSEDVFPANGQLTVTFDVIIK